jgi:hypothetical protein
MLPCQGILGIAHIVVALTPTWCIIISQSPITYIQEDSSMARPKKSKDGISKMEAVRQALAKHGKDTKPGDLLNHLKSDFGITMSYDMASTYKSAALKKKKGKRGRKPGPKPATAVAAVPTANGQSAGGISLEDITAVKALADRLGAEKVWQLAKVLAK